MEKFPVYTASGTFGYAAEMDGIVDFRQLGGIIPKTVTLVPRTGNVPPRTVETASGLLNSIGLDNDGIDEFIGKKLPYLNSLGTEIVVSVAAKNIDECPQLAEKLCDAGVKTVEFNISCPNVSGGVDYATQPELCESIVAKMRLALDKKNETHRAVKRPVQLWVKLSPNVWNIADIAKAAEAGGADAVSAVNTCLGLSVDWRKRRSRLGNGFGGLSGPAIKPIALRCVRQIYQAVKIPVVGIGGIETVDDAMEFFIAGASAIQVGTANFYNPSAAVKIIDALPAALAELGAQNVQEIAGTLA